MLNKTKPNIETHKQLEVHSKIENRSTTEQLPKHGQQSKPPDGGKGGGVNAF